MRYIIFCTSLLAVGILGLSCNRSAAVSDDSPTAAYKRLYEAVKSKNTDAIKAVMTKKSLSFATMASQKENVPVEKVLENGFEESTFSPTLPQIRDERIDGDMGAVEVYNSKRNNWDDVPFMREDGVWKLAIGDAFAGTYRSPGKSESQKEREAANAISNNLVPLNKNANVNMNAIKPMVPKPATNMPVRPANTPMNKP